MKKRLCAIILASVMCFTVAGCGGAEDSGDSDTRQEKEENEEKEEKEEKEETESKEAEADNSEKAEPTEAEVSYDEYEITKILTPFVEERAWVEFKNDDGEQVGFIDTEGVLRYSIEESALPPLKSGFDFPFTSYDGKKDITDGMGNAVFSDFNPQLYTYVKGSFEGEYIGSAFSNGSAFISTKEKIILLDPEGKETAALAQSEEQKFTILATYQGKYLVEEEISSFSEHKKIIYMIDKDGNKLTEDLENNFNNDNNRWFYNTHYERCEANGGIYCIYSKEESAETGGTLIYNLSNNDFYIIEGGHVSGVLPLPDGNAAMIINGMTKNAVVSFESFSDKESLEESIRENGNLNAASRILYPKGEGLYVELWSNPHNKISLYDQDGNPAFDEEFPEGTEIFGQSIFSGGQAVVCVQGNDGNLYYTAFDTEGNQVYDLQKFDTTQDCDAQDWSTCSQWSTPDKGYILVESPVNTSGSSVITPSGDMIASDGDLSEIPEDIHLFINPQYMVQGYQLSEGFVSELRDGNCFRSFDGSVVIDKVKVAK